ncbi:putative pyridoxal 5'-phosphate synthase subunit PDX1.1 [Dichanthelium oligosanthes]|uniref:pyridoxal 5'-phosphate synthase (glutamine hydrolyzing) n=1 Tax=Dichanthelium oligosanthes TaxID=888268 RepID=A0A1E5VLD9_9POAL|nr:putative pyridoxal 5'-phosphate synthase subunit PDX1.1 [Dichanthelium oligosanthes]
MLGGRPVFVLFGSSIVQYSFSNGGWGAALADIYARKDSPVQPSLVIVYFGGNDSIAAHSSGLGPHVPIDEYIDNMRKIAAHLKSLSEKTRVIFLSCPPLNEEMLRASTSSTILSEIVRTNETCRLYSDACVALCKEMNLKVVDLWHAMQRREDWMTACFTDGLHLSEEGSNIVVEEILKVLKEADWDPCLHWKALPTEFAEDSPYDLVSSSGDATLAHQLSISWSCIWMERNANQSRSPPIPLNPIPMASDGTGVVALYGGGSGNNKVKVVDASSKAPAAATFSVKVGLAQMLRGGVIMDVVTPEQARLAEEAGACAVMALERVPADIRAQGGVARMSDPGLIRDIKRAVTIPVMAKARIGHFVEAQILEAVGVDYVDESEVLTPADDAHHINKHNFRVPFVCGCRDLGEALRRVREGAAMIRTKGEAGTGNVVEAVRHVRSVMGDVRALRNMDDDEVFAYAKRIAAPYDLVMQTKQLGRLPVVQFAAGGVATPADAALMMQLGCDGVFVGSGIFKSGDPARRARAIVQAVTHYSDPEILADVSAGLGEAMVGINLSDPKVERYAARSE